jgi:hypothetical protein
LSKGKLMLTMLSLLVLALVVSGCAKKPTSGMVSGVLKWQDGAAISGAQVLIGEQSATSGANGAYSISDVPYGEYTLSVKYEGDIVHSQAVVVDKRSVLVDMEIKVPQYGSVSGTALKLDDTALATIRIGSRTATTDETGAYNIPKVMYGDYTVIVEYHDHDVFSEEISVAAGAVTLDIKLTEAGRTLVYEGFEGLSGTELPAGWEPFNDVGMVTGENAFVGLKSWKLPVGPTNNALKTPKVAAVPGRTYMLSANVILPKGCRFIFYFFDAEGKRPGTDPQKVMYGTDWAERSHTAVAPEGVVEVQAMFYFTKGDVAYGYFDEVRLVEMY